MRRRWRPVIPLAIAIFSLTSLLLVLLRVERRTYAALADLTDVADPARAAVTAVELTLSLENSGARAYLLSGDPRFISNHSALRSARERAQRTLMPLADQLGDGIARSAGALIEHLRSTDTMLDSLYDGGLSRQAYTARLEDEQERFTSIIAEAGRLEAAILRHEAEQRRAFAASQRLGATLSMALAAGAFVALALLARLGLGFQAQAIRLDAREQQHTALGDVARRLNASVGLADASRVVADGALAATSALGAVVELARTDDREALAWRSVVLRGGPMGTTSVPCEHSLTQRMIDQPRSASTISPAEVLDDAARLDSLARDGLSASVSPIMTGDRIRGALAIVRPRTGPRVRESETSYLNAVVELASSMLGRIELVSQLRISEERFRQVAENIRGFVWLRDPTSSRFLYANAGYEKIWGRTRESLYEDPRSWIEAIYPEDRPRVEAMITPERLEGYEVEYRIVRPNGEIRWVWSRGFPVRDEHGETYRMAGVTEDVTERRRASESRARLVRGFTHDVKNPLGAADGFLSLLEEGIFGPVDDRQRDSIARARASIRRALELISGALELARADTGELELQHVETDMRETIREVVSEYRAQAKAKGQELTTHLDDRVPAIESDPLRIRQIVANLLSNAIKYTPSAGHIEVQVTSAASRVPEGADWIVVDVTDTGPGIPPEKLPVVFEEFTRLDPNAADGAGVGLAISQRLAHALGGRLTVESAEGQGSRFSLWLPRRSGR